MLERKLTFVEGKIFSREFFEYDEDANLACSIVDDGSGESLDDLRGVTERRLQRIAYGGNFEEPNCGHPKEIVNSYLISRADRKCC